MLEIYPDHFILIQRRFVERTQAIYNMLIDISNKIYDAYGSNMAEKKKKIKYAYLSEDGKTVHYSTLGNPWPKSFPTRYLWTDDKDIEEEWAKVITDEKELLEAEIAKHYEDDKTNDITVD